ncbi:Multidrug efflux system transport protein [Alloalcanivorax dieselolei B5]|uniref:Multidrug efflux system transport protein n=2 Tax=Alloalcanivorax dieselolei TaxID=285091 RepID=K0CA47_ALCDB|nr:efflux RND transporter periplasmic adaptor subunit [Alloalcanivorax dieselolei]AFT69498.1 Multidrug efflux system transport protein [Alloalcanivorax dieselolei B5]
MRIRHLRRNSGVYALLLTVLAGCGPAQQEAASPPPRVAVVTVEAVRLELTEDMPARVAPFRLAEIRPQVSGIVQRRLFEQGENVQAGQPLFEINPAPFRAEVETAEAALQKAEAELARARTHAARLEPLVRAEAISRQVYDDAVSKRQTAAADVAQARATLSRRRLDLEFSTVTSPIAGRIDQALVTEGTLVASNDSTPMARVQQIDKVYVDIQRPASSLETLEEAVAAHASLEKGLPVTILRSNGTPYDVSGSILFSGINVDASTGGVLLRVVVENPQRRLLPGMFVRARVPSASYANALTVPQQSVVRIGGKPYVWVVDASDKVEMVAVQLGELTNGRYRVRTGLKEEQKVVVEGAERLSDGARVSARDWQMPVSMNASAASSH